MPISGRRISRRSPTEMAVTSWRRPAMRKRSSKPWSRKSEMTNITDRRRYDFRQVLERPGEIGRLAGRLEAQDLANHPPDVGRAFLGRNVALDVIGEDQEPDPIVGLDRGVGEQRRDLRRHLVLELRAGAERPRGADVDHQHHGQLALLAVHLDERVPHARRDLPVDVADVVARAVLAHLLELHAPPFEGAFVLAGEDVVDHPLGADLDRLDLGEQLGRQPCVRVDRYSPAHCAMARRSTANSLRQVYKARIQQTETSCDGALRVVSTTFRP